MKRMLLARYMRWLHTGWPAGAVEKLPDVREDGTCAVPGVRVVGDLTGIPLLKFAADSGARAVQAFLAEEDFRARRGRDPDVVDVAIVGGGVSGISAALEAQRAGLRHVVFEAAAPFSTVHGFPKGKPIFTYPTEMTPAGPLRVSGAVKEALLDALEAQRAGVEITAARVDRVERTDGELRVHLDGRPPVRALRVVIALGRSGNHRRLGVPGEALDKVFYRLHDPADHAGRRVLVVGGGDSAVESALALAQAGAQVTLSYRGEALARPKPETVAALRALERRGAVRLLLGSALREVTEEAVRLTDAAGQAVTLPNDVVFVMIGREAPLDFFRRSDIPIRGEWRLPVWAGFVAFFALCAFVYTWKGGTALNRWFRAHGWFPFGVPAVGDGPLARALTAALREPGFYYSLAYTIAVVLFGIRRVRRRRTPYVTRQTIALAAIQILPLFLLPYVVLPWMGHAGVFDHGVMKTVADHLFPDQSWWRAFGLVLAWPLFVWNVFSHEPLGAWLVIGLVQTFVIIPLIVRRWGKGAYCGFICSCGALAETLGDAHRHKMPHGPRWNRLNLVGQAILAFCFALFAARVVSWSWPRSGVGRALGRFYDTMFYNQAIYDYYHVVDLFLAGIVGVGLYFWFSGRVWCRFACPLAALMHIYARFSRFRIFADKKRCISCNVCTSVCHQGIDVMGFANKGLPMEDPQCVRCSACVQSCPTGVLTFGRLGKDGRTVYDAVPASPVQLREQDGRVHLTVL